MLCFLFYENEANLLCQLYFDTKDLILFCLSHRRPHVMTYCCCCDAKQLSCAQHWWGMTCKNIFLSSVFPSNLYGGENGIFLIRLLYTDYIVGWADFWLFANFTVHSASDARRSTKILFPQKIDFVPKRPNGSFLSVRITLLCCMIF